MAFLSHITRKRSIRWTQWPCEMPGNKDHTRSKLFEHTYVVLLLTVSVESMKARLDLITVEQFQVLIDYSASYLNSKTRC